MLVFDGEGEDPEKIDNKEIELYFLKIISVLLIALYHLTTNRGIYPSISSPSFDGLDMDLIRQ